MSTITKRVSKNVEESKRYQYWTSSENNDDGTLIAAGDIFMIEKSLGRPAKYLYIETEAGADLQIRLNSQHQLYRLRDPQLNWPVPGNDLENPITYTDDTMEPLVIGSDEVWELDKTMPISDIQIVAFDQSGGGFLIVVM